MSAKQTVIVEALKLSESERIELAEALYQSVEGPADEGAAQAWSEEIDRRLKEIDAGHAKFVPWEKARQEIRGQPNGATPD